MFATILVSGLLASAGAQASAESLRLKASAPAEIMVGEPTKLRVSWGALREVEVIPAKAQVWLDSGTGFHPYNESTFGSASTAYFPEKLARGASLVTEHVLGVSGYAAGPQDRHFELAFPRPGRYRARLQYEGVVSNEVTIEAVMPKGKDAEVIAQLRRRPELLSEWGLIEEFGAPDLEKLLDEYPASRHLARPRVLSWRKQLEEARVSDEQSRTRPSEGNAAQVLAGIESANMDDSPFEDDRLLLVGETAVSMGDRAKARAAYDRLIARNPSTAAAEKAKQWIAGEDRAVSCDQAQ